MAANSSVVEHAFIIVDGGLSDVNTPSQPSRIVTVSTIEISHQTKSKARQTKLANRLNDVLAALILLATCGFCVWSLLSSIK